MLFTHRPSNVGGKDLKEKCAYVGCTDIASFQSLADIEASSVGPEFCKAVGYPGD